MREREGRGSQQVLTLIEISKFKFLNFNFHWYGQKHLKYIGRKKCLFEFHKVVSTEIWFMVQAALPHQRWSLHTGTTHQLSYHRLVQPSESVTTPCSSYMSTYGSKQKQKKYIFALRVFPTPSSSLKQWRKEAAIYPWVPHLVQLSLRYTVSSSLVTPGSWNRGYTSIAPVHVLTLVTSENKP